jgi:prefoldin beta subunit
MAGQLPPQIQNQLAQLQELQQQAQVVISQRQQLEVQVREVERTLEELVKVGPEAPLFRSVGSLLVSVQDRAKLEADLRDQQETMMVRLESAKRQEARLRERMQSMQNELQAALGGVGGPR